MSDDTNKPVLFVKKADSKKGSLWNKLTNRRIIKQHGGFDIPEGDNHAIPKYHSPLDEKQASPEETKETLTELEKEIRELKEKDRHTSLPPQSPYEEKNRFTNEPHDYKKKDDDLY
jgi:NAD(P)H-dependent FMN reductase